MTIMTDLNTAVLAAYEQLTENAASPALAATGQASFEQYRHLGWPTQKLESWKYTRLAPLVQKPFELNGEMPSGVSAADLMPENNRLASVVGSGNQIIFVNGLYAPALSNHDAAGMELLPLTEAAEKYPEYISQYLNHSKKYITDGLQALNTAFLQNGLFIRVKKNTAIKDPVFLNHFTQGHLFVQPRIFIIVEENAQVQFAENYFHNGTEECFTNEIIEITVQDNARMEYYKVQHLPANAHQVGTTHIVQAGKCFTHCATITLSGGTIRNNLNMVFEKENNEGHLYGLYLVNGTTHIDNHTVVDNTQPGCYSNELYKGVIDEKATAVFNGRIYVRKDAQKTNAYQSNRNILLGANASVNAKPQLEIFADDVKCSHGCTVGRLDETALFYMRTRGISEEKARALLLQAFAADIVGQVKIPALQQALHEMIAERLHTELT
jgi:Fe-S cluster assembly protein SufD